jgi:uncharacterized membrane-anchored protein
MRAPSQPSSRRCKHRILPLFLTNRGTRRILLTSFSCANALAFLHRQRAQDTSPAVERRLAPAMQTCETAAKRLESLSRRLARASDLLRTQVDVALQAQNRDLLLSMDRRARLQSRLQRILEVISIVALTYYLAGLLTTILRAVKTVGVPLDVELIVGTAVPLLLGIVWLAVRWTRHTVIRRHEKNLD